MRVGPNTEIMTADPVKGRPRTCLSLAAGLIAFALALVGCGLTGLAPAPVCGPGTPCPTGYICDSDSRSCRLVGDGGDLDGGGDPGASCRSWLRYGDGCDCNVSAPTCLCQPFRYRRAITIRADKVVEPLEYFPLLVHLPADAAMPGKPSGGGFDFRFTDLSGTVLLPHEVERYDDISGELVAWVQVPLLATNANTRICLYYGAVIDLDETLATQVWQQGYSGVWHLDRAVAEWGDSTVNRWPTSADGSVVPSVVGKIGRAMEFTGVDPSYLLIDDGTRTGDSPFTLEAWVLVRSFTTNEPVGLLQKGRDSALDWYGLFYLNGEFLLGWSGVDQRGQDQHHTPMSLGDWHHAACSFDGQFSVCYLNGQEIGPPTPHYYRDITRPSTMGTDLNLNGYSLDGLMDEVRISEIVRGPAWIATQFANQSAPGDFYQLGDEEEAD